MPKLGPMSENASQPVRSGVNPSLVERVRARVEDAGRALQRRADTSAPPVRRRPAPNRPAPSLKAPQPATPVTREIKALRVVYRDLGETHRRYRLRTGRAPTPALRAAARAFKQEPSLISLVPVAGFLDDLGLLEW